MKSFLFPISILVAVAVILAVSQWLTLRKAHSTFENYYAFRGCQELLTQTPTEGTCKLSDGSVIKIVKFQGKWYLDGDLPWACIGNLCIGI